jgi:hypothetical protein
LSQLFQPSQIEKEWDVAKKSRDAYTRKLYCPRIDIAVGPFNINRNIYDDNLQIAQTVQHNSSLLRALIKSAEIKPDSIDTFLSNLNRNPRCFMAIEIEKSGTRKHLLGDMANSSIIGAIGIVIPLNKSILNGFKGIQRYIRFATEMKKIQSIFNNVLIIKPEKFFSILEKQIKQK